MNYYMYLQMSYMSVAVITVCESPPVLRPGPVLPASVSVSVSFNPTGRMMAAPSERPSAPRYPFGKRKLFLGSNVFICRQMEL